MKVQIKSISTLLALLILVGTIPGTVNGEDYFVSEIMNCITKVSCVQQYKICAADQTCSSILNAQSQCRVNSKCNQNSKLIWDPNCYLNCVSTNKNVFYKNLVQCSSQECHAHSQFLNPVIMITVLFYFIIYYV
ncbi:hypothetical protein ABPG72_018024 [Tetrahymena utriculariae]